MSESTPRLSIPYPSLSEDPHYPSFEAMVLAIDAALFAAWEDSRLLVEGVGSTWTWTLGTETLSWDAPIVLVSPSTGRLMTIAAGSLVLTAGQYAVVDVVRAAASDQTIVPYAASQVSPTGGSAFVLAKRSGSSIVFRNGVALNNAGSADPWGP